MPDKYKKVDKDTLILKGVRLLKNLPDESNRIIKSISTQLKRGKPVWSGHSRVVVPLEKFEKVKDNFSRAKLAIPEPGSKRSYRGPGGLHAHVYDKYVVMHKDTTPPEGIFGGIKHMITEGIPAIPSGLFGEKIVKSAGLMTPGSNLSKWMRGVDSEERRVPLLSFKRGGVEVNNPFFLKGDQSKIANESGLTNVSEGIAEGMTKSGLDAGYALKLLANPIGNVKRTYHSLRAATARDPIAYIQEARRLGTRGHIGEMSQDLFDTLAKNPDFTTRIALSAPGLLSAGALGVQAAVPYAAYKGIKELQG